MDRGGMRHGTTRPVSIQNLIFTKPIQRILLLVALLLCAEMGWGQIAQRGTATSATTNTTSLTINKPSGVVGGDLLIVNITQTGNTNTNATSTGWTVIAGARQSTGPRYTTALYRVVDGTEGASFTFTLGAGTGSGVGSIIAFSGVDASLFDVSPGSFNTGGSTSITATGISTISNNAAIVFIAGAGGTDGDVYDTWSGTNPTFNEIMDSSHPSVNNSVGIAWGILPTAGATGNKTVGVDGNYYWAGMLIALRPMLTSPITFTSSGNFTVPAGVTCIQVEAWGGGGGGSTITNNNRRGGGGGGGAYARSAISVNPGNTYTVTVGSGGTASTGGGNSSFGSLVIAAGGSGGTNNNTAGGAGGTIGASTGEIRYAGGAGANGDATNNYSGGGGGGAGSNGNGGSANGATAGLGTTLFGGDGGDGRNGSIDGSNGNNIGGGGGGAVTNSGTDRYGGAGAPGQIIVTWTGLTPTNTPTVNSPILNGATTISGTSDANAAITVYSNGTSIGTPTANASGIWSLTVSARSTGQVITARAKVAGQCESELSSSTTVTSITITTGSISPLSYCPGEAVSVPYSITGTFTAGNVFTAQLSDASGSFASPVSIGSVTSTSGGTISATLPGYANGTGYRIRVVSSTPAVTGSNNGSDIAVQSPVVITSPGSQCFNGSPITVNVGASCASAGIFRWYSDAGGTNLLYTSPLGTSSVYTAVDITSTQTYYVSVTVGSCTSNLYPVSAYAIIPPTLNASAGGSFCTTSTISLTSSASNYDNIFWEGPNGYYTTEANPTRTNAQTNMSGTYTVTTSSLSGVNLVTNGSFEQGRVGFSSTYIYAPDQEGINNELNSEGRYSVTTMPNRVHNNFCNSCAAYSGSMQMVINGATTANQTIWSQTVNVVPSTYYQFSYWVQSVVNGDDDAPSQLQLYVNGVASGPVYTAEATTGLWTQFIYNWSSASSTSALLELRNQNTTAGGNDFALDDIIFQHTCLASASVDVYVAASFTPSVTVSASANPVCSGQSVTFTANPLHGGASPSYQWRLNGTDIPGATNSTYTTSSLANGAQISCRMNSSLTSCLTVGSNPTTSAAVTMTVNPLPTITTTGTLVSVRNNPSSQTTTLAYAGTTASPTSYSIDWNSTANASGLADQGSTAFAFTAGAGTITGIVVSANVPEGTYTGTMTIVNANGCSNTQAVQLTVLPMTIIDSHPDDLNLCQNASGSFSVTSSVSSATYQWQYSTNGTDWNPTDGVAGVSGHTSSTLNINSAPYTGATVWVRCVVTDGAYSEPSSSAVFTVFQAPSAPAVQSIVQPTCSDATGSVTLNGLPSGTWTLTRNPGAIKTTGTGSSTTISGLSTGPYTFEVANEDASWGCPTGSGTGLLAEFFSNMTLSGSPVLTRIDPTVNFDWANGSPGAPLGVDGFSVRWSGKIQPCNTGTYTFRTRSDDGIRLWVNGTQIINNWTNHAATYNEGTISLTAGQKYDIVLEFYENGGQAVAELNWTLPGGSTFEIIPSSQLYYEATGCTSESTSVTINAQPATPTQPTIIASGATTFCAGGSVTLSAPASSGYLWSTGATSQDIVVTTSGNYTVQVSNAAGCQSVASAAVSVTVNPLPDATLIVTDPVVCLSQFATITVQNTQFNVGYQLRLDSDNSAVGAPVFGDGGNKSFTITPSNTNVYNILATNTNNCSVELTDKATVTVNQIEVSTTNTTGDTNDCADFGVPFNANTDQYNPGTTLLSFTVTRQHSSVNWSFDFSVSGGTVYSTLAQLPSGAIGTSPIPVNTSTPLVLGISSGAVNVDSSVNAVVMQFYIVNTPGSSQTVVFNATNVEDTNSCTGSNRNVSHTILPMPAIGGFN